MKIPEIYIQVSRRDGIEFESYSRRDVRATLMVKRKSVGFRLLALSNNKEYNFCREVDISNWRDIRFFCFGTLEKIANEITNS